MASNWATAAQSLPVRIAREASIIHPTKGRIAFRPFAFQRNLWLDTARKRVILKARQMGISQAVAAEALYKAMLVPNKTILFISKNAADAIRLLKQAKDIYDGLVQPISRATKNILNEMTFANGSSIISVAAQKNAGRGYPASDIYLDEAAFLQWAEDIYLSIAPAVSLGGTLTVLSTPNGQSGLFFDIWRGMYGKDWSHHKLPFWKRPDYDQAWYISQSQAMPRSQFAGEHECSFVASGDPVFRYDSVMRCPVGWLGLQDPVPGHLYITAWDLARKSDYTVGITLDCTTPIHQVVAFERHQKMPFPQQQGLIANRWWKYPGLHTIEGNFNGFSVVENLYIPSEDNPYPIPASSIVVGKSLTQITEQGIELPECPVTIFQTGARSKDNAITSLQLAVEGETFKHGIEEMTTEMVRYRRADRKLMTDTVMASAIGEWAAQHVPVTLHYETDDRVQIGDWDRDFGMPGWEGWAA